MAEGEGIRGEKMDVHGCKGKEEGTERKSERVLKRKRKGR